MRSAFSRSAVLVLAGWVLTCAPAEPPEVIPAQQATIQPEIRIGLVVGAPVAEVGSDATIEVLGENAEPLGALPRESGWTVSTSGGQLLLRARSGWQGSFAGPISFKPASGSLLSLGGKPYHGSLTVFRDRTGLTTFNRVGMEDYLAGVVSAEMGRRDPSDREALASQAVISRTYALKNLGKRRAEGFDLYPTVVDQVYGGIGAETPMGWDAVRETTGQVLTFGGVPIDAFFYSTCGGRTADGTEVYAGANRPYLRSIADEDANGQAYCSISPRFRWREEWTGDQLRGILQRGLGGASFSEVRGVRVVARSRSDRVVKIAIAVDNNEIPVEGPAVRQVLHPVGEPLLRSGAFTLTEERQGRVLTGLVAEGRGAGHGVGFCQWGAVGRARAGQDFQQILTAYFPGTSLQRTY